MANSFVASRVKAEEDRLKAVAKPQKAALLMNALATGADPASAETAQQVINSIVRAEDRRDFVIDESDTNLRISLEGRGAVDLTKGVTNIKQLGQQHEALIDFVFANSKNLTADSYSALLGLSQQQYIQRSDYYSPENIAASSQHAFRNGQERGYFNAHQAVQLRKASFTGFDGNMTDADRWGAISTQTRRWGQEDTGKILAGMAAVTFAPMMAADLLAVGALAARGGMALGRFSLEGVNNVGRMMYSQYQAHGARGMLLNAGYSTNGLSLEVAKYASLKSAQRTAGYVARNPLATLQAGFSATGRALTPILKNENVQAGLINGFVNTSYEAFINGKTDMLDLGKTFVATSVGGYFGSRVSNSAAFSSMSTLNREVMAGFIGNASSEALTQFGNYMLSDDDYTFNGTKVLTSGLLGAGFGGGLVNLGLTKPPVFIFSDAVRDPVVKGLAASYGVSFSFTELTK